MEIKGATFLITGGSSGIGKATAKEIITRGGKVAITGRNREKLEKIAEQLGAFPIHANVAKEEDVEKTYKMFLDKFGKIDCLINNAGIGTRAAIDEIDMDQMREIYEINVFGATMMGIEAAKLFKKQNHGNIINIASTAAMKGYKTGSMYASSKFALRGLTQCWQADLRPHNVRVMLINPSEVTTAFAQPERVERDEEAKKLRSKEIADAIIGALEMDNRGFVPELTVWATNPF